MSVLPITVKAQRKPETVVVEVREGELHRRGGDGEPEILRVLVPARVTCVMPVWWTWEDPDSTCECCGGHEFQAKHVLSLN